MSFWNVDIIPKIYDINEKLWNFYGRLDIDSLKVLSDNTENESLKILFCKKQIFFKCLFYTAPFLWNLCCRSHREKNIKRHVQNLTGHKNKQSRNQDSHDGSACIIECHSNLSINIIWMVLVITFQNCITSSSCCIVRCVNEQETKSKQYHITKSNFVFM